MDKINSIPHLTPEEPDHKPDRLASKSAQTLAIALVVSAVLLLIAIAIAIWLLTKDGQAQPEVKNSQVSDASFVTPTDLPKNYKPQTQDTNSSKSTAYFDSGKGCGITTTKAMINNKKPDQAIEDYVKNAASLGVATAHDSQGPDYQLKDSKGDQTYTFKSRQIEQNVNLPNVSFKKQFNTVAYEKFNDKLLTIAYYCKDDTWEANKSQLEEAVKKFTIKTERR